jgi:putative DNA primase/helicase
MAARHRCAVLSVTHLNKAGGGSANHRIIGSIAFIAVARAGYIVCADPDEPRRGLFIPSKNNLGPPRDGLAFRVEGVDLGNDVRASRIAWEPQAVTMTANEALTAPTSLWAPQRDAPARDTGEEFLRALLADGPMLGSRVQAEAKTAGVAMRTLYRAKDKLGVRLAKQGLDGGWAWSLPPKDDA